MLKHLHEHLYALKSLYGCDTFTTDNGFSIWVFVKNGDTVLVEKFGLFNS